MKTHTRLTIGLGLVACTGTAFAQADEGLSGQVAFGYLATTGNAENQNLNLNFGGEYVRGNWTHSLTGLAVKATTNEETTAEAYGLAWQTNYEFSENNYAFGRLGWDKDEFSAYKRQTREIVGYGRRIIDSERHVLNGEVGIGARQGDLRDGTSQDGEIARLSLDYTWTISETATFAQTFALESGSDNTYTETMSSLSADVWGDFAIVLSYTIKRNSTVPVGVAKRDTNTAIALEYSF
jgi:putative salt-induced outer membrane protein